MPDDAPASALGDALARGREVAPAEGGDPACWMDRVCGSCGLLLETDSAVCPRCGVPVD